MRIAVPPQRAELELLDRPGAVLALLGGNLADIRRLNRRFGGTALATREVWKVLGGRRSVSLLDVATGSADIPLALLRQSRDRGLQLRITALDSSPEILGEARRMIGDWPVHLVEGDARDLPFPETSFDVVLSCLALHHLPRDGAVRMLREMSRVSRNAIIVTDLRRSWPGFLGAWLVTHALTRNPLTRHDGPLSVLRAYTPREVRELASEAGLEAARVRLAAPFRLVLVARRGGGARGG